MTMRDRLRRNKTPKEALPEAQSAPPPSTGPDEETVRIARKDFRRRRNAGRWRRFRLVLLAVLLVAAVAASVWVVFFSSYVTARNVDVTGTSTLGDGRIERAADVPTGTPLARLDLGAIRARVEGITAVRSAAVSRSWPHTVHIEVTERTAIAVIDQGNGLRGLDDQGVLFGHYATRPKRMPLVNAPPGTPAEALAEGGRVIGSLPAGIASRVETVEVGSVDKIQLVLGNGRRIMWGSADDSGQKAEVLAVLLRRPGQQIDVSVPGRPTTR
jgi:cell division protein FtsQ